jgi:hypothetical protein
MSRVRLSADGGSRLVVSAQRHPWTTSLVVAAASVGVLLVRMQFDAEENISVRWMTCWKTRWTSLLAEDEWAIAVGSTISLLSFLAHIVPPTARSTWDRLAPWVAANLAAVAFALAFVHDPAWTDRPSLPEALVVAVPLALWPLGSRALVDASVDRKSTGVIAVILCAGVVASGPLGSPSSAAAIFGLALLPPAFHDATRLATPALLLVLLAALLAVIAAPLTLSTRSYGTVHELGPRPAFATALVIAALLVLAARRCRSMTAVPHDHPVVADFGGR